MACYIGLDIGGTKLMVAAADQNLNILQRRRADTPEGLQDGLSLLHTMISEVSDGLPILGIGTAIGGQLDWRTGIVSPLHQPTWRNVPFKAIMEREWECACHLDVDTNVAALGEYVLGNENGSLFYITVSTGIGGGFVQQGRLYRGNNDAHPEFGHQSIPVHCRFPERVHCECGAPDCLEALASGNAIRRIYYKPAEQLDASEWEEVTYHLAQGIRNAAMFYTPDVIVLGGGVAIGRGERLISDVMAFLHDHLRVVPVPDVRLSKLGYDTALMGALVLARDGLS
ncbi:ROK family protein [candidate division KSB1 bacterium]|nr:ROK family protein [candidate division KSB1 bacterium]